MRIWNVFRASAMRFVAVLPLALSVSATTLPANAAQGVTVFAAASMTDAVSEIARVFEAQTGTKLTLSFAGSGTLARQVEAGAPADIFISADEAWMAYLEKAGSVQAETIRAIASNAIVLVGAPAAADLPLEADAIVKALDTSRLAIADPDTVPAGRYAKEALVKLDLWQALQSKMAPMENVRVALASVARGDTRLGIVYSSDAVIEPRVHVVARFPQDSHRAIRYPAALTTKAGQGEQAAAALAFLDFLSGAEAGKILADKGFAAP